MIIVQLLFVVLLFFLFWAFMSFVVPFLELGLLRTFVALGEAVFTLRWLTLPKFALFFLKILVQSNLQVARIVLRPGFKERPRIVRLDIANLTPAQATTLASIITLTPGTLSMDMSDDGRWLTVHCMSGDDRGAIERSLNEVKQRLMTEVFR